MASLSGALTSSMFIYRLHQDIKAGTLCLLRLTGSEEPASPWSRGGYILSHAAAAGLGAARHTDKLFHLGTVLLCCCVVVSEGVTGSGTTQTTTDPQDKDTIKSSNSTKPLSGINATVTRLLCSLGCHCPSVGVLCKLWGVGGGLCRAVSNLFTGR